MGAPPLPHNWRINPESGHYEHLSEGRLAMSVSIQRPNPPTIPTMKGLLSVHQARREYEISILRPAGKGDSDSYLSYLEVAQRDRDFNDIYGIENSHGWLAVSKEDVPVGEGDSTFTTWEVADATKIPLQEGDRSRKCLDRVAYWRKMGGGLVVESNISSEGNHPALAKWYH